MKLPKLPKDTEYYQDVWYKGKCVKKGSRDCETRYNIIKKELDKIKEPLRVLDVGSNMGYYGLRIMEDYPDASVFMVESNKEYQDFAREMFLLNGTVGHFFDGQLYRGVLNDVKPNFILLLAVLHWVSNPYQVLSYLVSDDIPVIVESPTEEEIDTGIWSGIPLLLRDHKNFFTYFNTKKIGEVDSHLVHVKRPLYRMTQWRKLNLGCGNHVLPDYLGIDLHNPAAHIRDDLRTLVKINSDTITDIYCSHAIIYVHPSELKTMFSNWYRVLQKGGTMILEYPTNHEEWELIKYAPDPDKIMQIIRECGFTDVKEVPTRRYSRFYGKKAPLYEKWLNSGKKGPRPDYHNVTIQGVK